MAFATSTLVNGQWTTRPLDVNAVLQHYDQEDRNARAIYMEVEKPPVLGLLTQTVIRSPLAHWILPIRLRSPKLNDVAFIGDDFVQIKELRGDRQLWDVVRKENFGARIRNARVIGTIDLSLKGENSLFGNPHIKDDDDDLMMDSGETSLRGHPRKVPGLSPQFILLQLETGDSVFLTLRQTETGVLQFVSSRHRVPKPMLKLQPGMQLCADPSSRYMAVGCSEAIFAIYALHPRDTLSEQYRLESNIRPVESETYIAVRGVILKMEFLHPAAGDEGHIILLVLVVVRGKTRMLLYEWEAGNDLKNVRAHSTRGHLLEESRQVPLLLIPLTIKSSFILIYESFMTVCRRILEGQPEFLDFNHKIDPPTKLHHGQGRPLWTSWTRPTRREDYRVHRDDIYIVREDGVLKLLETDSDLDEFVKANMNVGELSGNCGTALASLDHHTKGSKSGDMLITGGDSCAGGTYLIQARGTPIFTEPIQNWSPAVDMTTTYVPQQRQSDDEWTSTRRKRQAVQMPDKIYACVGNGSKGSVTEFWYGLEAKLGLVTDYEIPIMDAWVLCPNLHSWDDGDDSLFLLSLANGSAALCLSADATAISELDEESTQLDLRYRTIIASMHKDCTIQVTEQSIVVINGLHFHRVHEKDELLKVNYAGTSLGHGPMIEKAVVHKSLVLFTTRLDNSTYLQALDYSNIETGNASHIQPPKHQTLGKYSPTVSSIGICVASRSLWVVIADVRDGSSFLTFKMIERLGEHELRIPTSYGDNHVDIDAVVSIAAACRSPGFLTILCGTGNGLLLTLELDENTLQLVSCQCDRLGVNQMIIKRDEHQALENQFFVSCDSKIYTLSPSRSVPSTLVPEHSTQTWKIQQVWLTDAERPYLEQPEVTSIQRLKPNLPGGTEGGVLMVAGSQILLAALSAQPQTVPRHIPVGGTPTRLFYSDSLDLLIVAAIVEGKSTILFLDPKTGEDLSMAYDQNKGAPADFVSGLGNFDERIFHLMEWSYVKDKKAWNFIIVSTSSGRLLIISTSMDSSTTGARTRSGRAKVRFYTRYKFKCAEPIYCVTGFSDGLIWCSGNKLFCDTLDLKDKKFKRVAEYELCSPATSLRYDNDVIYALTSCHSLEVLKLITSDGRESKIVHTHVSQVSRNTLHHALIEGVSERPIHLVSDKDSSVWGLWATPSTKADTLQTVFQAQLPHSILRFRFGRCRPVWDPVWIPNRLQFNSISGSKDPSSVGFGAGSADAPEILGLSIDGSISHFTVLDFAAWRFLRFLINQATRSPRICEFTHKDDTPPLEPMKDPKTTMHIDGDILKRCLEDQRLEELLRVGQQSSEAVQIFSKFYETLQGLHQGKLVKDAAPSVYVQQAYEDLAFFLRPVL
ncbi:uncharacterized protein BP5553_08049 [Venustampulla echinocandica]|uniref:RSE1/DDB1/CPSF1 first beta-propeller domain-containing protein n=1 Tax=Venustampulla echinocandica TaxID=2656787 RepID=A0A370TFM5_9HELO|nr:uncharacterized protein BP5553_08049 [Venustampulla echinocandica]RDL33681.1 hypothetical protein BP5553_08049 [Venustampulla echinocandica]